MNERQIKSMAREYAEYAKKELATSEICEDPEGNMIKSAYLGSIINPSGKYYTPWANSNVDACPRCNGSGSAKRDQDCQYCEGTGVRSIEKLANARGADFYSVFANLVDQGITILEGDNITCWLCNGSGRLHPTCNFCGGLGSREAYEDQLFWEYLEDYAQKIGAYVESGEGDPCDTFLCSVVESEDTEL